MNQHPCDQTKKNNKSNQERISLRNSIIAHEVACSFIPWEPWGPLGCRSRHRDPEMMGTQRVEEGWIGETIAGCQASPSAFLQLASLVIRKGNAGSRWITNQRASSKLVLPLCIYYSPFYSCRSYCCHSANRLCKPEWVVCNRVV